MVGDFCFTGVGLDASSPYSGCYIPWRPAGRRRMPTTCSSGSGELGLPGAAAYALLILSIVVQGVKRLRRAPGADASDPQLPMLVASLAAITAMLTQGLLDAAVWGNKGAFCRG